MGTDEFSDAVERAKRHDASVQAYNERLRVASRREMAFEQQWNDAYPNGMDVESEGFANESIRRLMLLVPEIHSRYWDFFLPELLIGQVFFPESLEHLREDVRLATMILRDACENNQIGLSSKLKTGTYLIEQIKSAHVHLPYFMNQLAMNGLPPTPRLTLAHLGRILGKKRYQIDNEKRRNEWITGDVGVNAKRWRHIDSSVHKLTLARIREINPKIIWEPPTEKSA